MSDSKKKSKIVADMINEAKAEVDDEVKQAWKSEIKMKIKQLRNAQTLANNIAREIEDLEIRIGEELG